MWAWPGLAEHQVQVQTVKQVLPPAKKKAALKSRQFEKDFKQRYDSGLNGLDVCL